MNNHFVTSDVDIITSNHSHTTKCGEERIFAVAAIKDGGVIPECLYGGLDNRKNLYDYGSIKVSEIYDNNLKIEEAYLLHILYWGNFFHFMTELLPNMYHYKKTLLDKGCKIIVPDRNRLIDECLETLSIPDDMVITLKPSCCYSVSKMHYSSTASIPGNSALQVEAFTYFQEFFQDISCATAPQKLYISRADKINPEFNNNANGQDRVLSNENDVLNLVTDNGYEVHTVGTKTFKEKSELLSNAETIITPHGGNILNCCLAKNLKRLIILTCKYAEFCDNIFYNFVKALLPNVEILFVEGTQDENPDGKLVYSILPFKIKIDDLTEALTSEL